MAADTSFRKLGIMPSALAGLDEREAADLVVAAYRFRAKLFHPDIGELKDEKKFKQVQQVFDGIDPAHNDAAFLEQLRRARRLQSRETAEPEVKEHAETERWTAVLHDRLREWWMNRKLFPVPRTEKEIGRLLRFPFRPCRLLMRRITNCVGMLGYSEPNADLFYSFSERHVEYSNRKNGELIGYKMKKTVFDGRTTVAPEKINADRVSLSPQPWKSWYWERQKRLKAPAAPMMLFGCTHGTGLTGARRREITAQLFRGKTQHEAAKQLFGGGFSESEFSPMVQAINPDIELGAIAVAVSAEGEKLRFYLLGKVRQIITSDGATKVTH